MIFAGTGHRPPKLGLDYSNKSNTHLRFFCDAMLRKIMIEKDVTGVISGGSTGFDLALAESSIDLGVAVTLALPFHGFGKNWPLDGQQRLWDLMGKCKVIYVDEAPYTSSKQYAARDRYMVDNADAVVALYSGDPKTGTGLTVSYANKQVKPVINLWDDWELYKCTHGIF